jgi:hypothetical protein
VNDRGQKPPASLNLSFLIYIVGTTAFTLISELLLKPKERNVCERSLDIPYKPNVWPTVKGGLTSLWHLCGFDHPGAKSRLRRERAAINNQNGLEVVDEDTDGATGKLQIDHPLMRICCVREQNFKSLGE